MHFDVSKRTILKVRHGSHAYGTNVATSDEDFKGVCVKPKEAYFGFTQRFEQHEHMGSKTDGVDEVIYSLDKFAALAADCNPNIIEVLHVANKDVLFIDEFGEELRAHRNDFLSKKAKHTFSGYANAQLKRIKTHRAWLLDPPKEAPKRKDFGLLEAGQVSKSELGAFDSLMSQLGKDGILADPHVSPLEQAISINLEARDKLGVEFPASVITLFTKEKAYQAAKTHYDQYLNWKKTRNPARAELEAKFGYDTKHGMHLIRLQTMGVEILEEHVVYVDRTYRDRPYLMKVRNGEVSYDELIEKAERLEKRGEELYKTSTLRKEPDRVSIDRLIVGMTDRYLRKYG